MRQLHTTLLVIFTAFISTASVAQMTVSNAIGSSVFFKGAYDEPNLSQGFTYAPRLNFYFFGSEHTLSVGTVATVVPWFASYSGVGSNKPLLAFDLPLTIDANFGHYSDDDAESGFGGFIGIGGGYNNIWDYDYDTYRQLPGNGGIVFNGGIRFDSYVIGSYTLRGSYMLSLGRASNVIGLNILVNIGDF